MMPLILASSSVYRKALLDKFQIPYQCYSPDIVEDRRPDESLAAMVLRLSLEKAQAASEKHPQAACIGSDAVAVLEGKILLGKPGNHATAVQQLTQMSGKTVEFYTGVCLYAPSISYSRTELVITSVIFRELSLSMIENYCHKEKPYFSAGSFKSESLGAALIQGFIGEDPNAMIGLPLIKLSEMLREIGIEVI